MKVYVSQGHEKGIGLEVFFKSCLMLTVRELSNIKLLAFASAVEETLKTLRIPFTLHKTFIELGSRNIAVEWIPKTKQSMSFDALTLAMKKSEQGGVLFTLPTSKDQFPKGFAGHTEYFRHHYKSPELGMFFSSPKLQVLLITDHLPVNSLSKVLSEELIYQRLKEAIQTLEKWNWPTKRILVSGLNPHAGENGLIGDEDQRVAAAIRRLKDTTTLEMRGPLPGDTMLFEQRSSEDLLVYLFHDQGLGVFKGLQGFIGSNITLGLPYPRFSPDHGTSFQLFGQNKADYRGCEFSLKQAVMMLEKLSYGKNSNHKG